MFAASVTLCWSIVNQILPSVLFVYLFVWSRSWCRSCISMSSHACIFLSMSLSDKIFVLCSRVAPNFPTSDEPKLLIELASQLSIQIPEIRQHQEKSCADGLPMVVFTPLNWMRTSFPVQPRQQQSAVILCFSSLKLLLWPNSVVWCMVCRITDVFKTTNIIQREAAPNSSYQHFILRISYLIHSLTGGWRGCERYDINARICRHVRSDSRFVERGHTVERGHAVEAVLVCTPLRPLCSEGSLQEVETSSRYELSYLEVSQVRAT